MGQRIYIYIAFTLLVFANNTQSGDVHHKKALQLVLNAGQTKNFPPTDLQDHSTLVLDDSNKDGFTITDDGRTISFKVVRANGTTRGVFKRTVSGHLVETNMHLPNAQDREVGEPVYTINENRDLILTIPLLPICAT